MHRRYIALKPGAVHWGFAVATGDQTAATLVQAGLFERDPQRPLAEQLADLFGPLQLTDRLACALPASSALLRWLEFPFSEVRKISAAALPEMARLVPESLEKRTIFHHPLGKSTGKTLAAAVAMERIEDLLGQFDDNREPLGYLGLSPFCTIAGLDWPVNSLLLSVADDEILLCRCEESNLVDLRTLPQDESVDDSTVIQQALLLAHGTGTPLMRLRLLGVAADSTLAKGLEQAGFEVDPVKLVAQNGRVAEAQTTVACLALAATKAPPGGMNLRSGPYKLKNEWQAIKRRAWTVGVLLLFSLLIFAGSGYLQYFQRAAELKGLQQQMTTLYQQQFPGEKLLVSAPLQLQSRLKELKKKSGRFGTRSPGALQSLLAVSTAIDADVSIIIREYLHEEEGVRLAGSTSNFDAVSKLLNSLKQEPLFKEVRVLDSKQAIDGSRVEFQLQIQLAQTKGE